LNDFNRNINGTIEIVKAYFAGRSAKTENLALRSKLKEFKK